MLEHGITKRYERTLCKSDPAPKFGAFVCIAFDPLHNLVAMIAETRRNILLNARSLLAREGPAGTTLRAVAQASSMRLAAIQYHFAARADLMNAMIEQAIGDYEEALRPILDDASLGPHQRLEETIYWLTRPSADWAEMERFEVQLWAMARVDKDAATALQRYLARYREVFAELIAKAAPKPISPEEAERRATIVCAMIEGMTVVSISVREQGQDTNAFGADIARSALLIALGRTRLDQD